MTNDNKTVKQVCEELRQFKDCDGEYVHEIEDLADEAEAAHNREIAEKDAEIERLANIKKEHINLQTHVAALRREATLKQDQNIEQGHQYRGEIKSLRALVGELANALDASCDCHCHCDGCKMADESKFDCPDKAWRALVARAREMIGGAK